VEGEISPSNRLAIRGPNGVWNEHVLPVTAWEAAEQRLFVPEVLLTSLTLPVAAVLRWDAEKFRDALLKHPRDERMIRSLTEYLAGWRDHGEEVGDRTGSQRILFQDEHGRWCAASIGPLLGSDNMITVFGSSKPNVVTNRLHELNNSVAREK